MKRPIYTHGQRYKINISPLKTGQLIPSQAAERRQQDQQPVTLASTRSEPAPFPRIVMQKNATSNDELAVRNIASQLYAGRDGSETAIAADEDDRYSGNLVSAIQKLQTAWPEAAVELSLLIERIIRLDDTELTASHNHLFGIMLAGTDALETESKAYETILHECGHHAMFVREWNTDYLLNPEEIATHPLRKDPRPMEGILHAAFVLWRMSQGLERLAVIGDEPEVARRLSENTDKLKTTLAVLGDKAHWSPTGEMLFSQMCLSQPTAPGTEDA